MKLRTHEEYDPQMTQMHADTQKRDEQTHAVISTAMTAHGELGHGFLEAVYLEALLEHKRLVFNLRESASSADK